MTTLALETAPVGGSRRSWWHLRYENDIRCRGSRPCNRCKCKWRLDNGFCAGRASSSSRHHHSSVVEQSDRSVMLRRSCWSKIIGFLGDEEGCMVGEAKEGRDETVTIKEHPRGSGGVFVSVAGGVCVWCLACVEGVWCEDVMSGQEVIIRRHGDPRGGATDGGVVRRSKGILGMEGEEDEEEEKRATGGLTSQEKDTMMKGATLYDDVLSLQWASIGRGTLG